MWEYLVRVFCFGFVVLQKLRDETNEESFVAFEAISFDAHLFKTSQLCHGTAMLVCQGCDEQHDKNAQDFQDGEQ